MKTPAGIRKPMTSTTKRGARTPKEIVLYQVKDFVTNQICVPFNNFSSYVSGEIIR